MDFTNQTAIVTGGSRGIGRAVVRMLAERGASVVVGYHTRAEAAAATVAACAELPGTAVEQRVDVRDRKEVDTLVDWTLERWVQIYILVNCAGFAPYAPVADVTSEQWRATLATNLDGVYHTCKAVLRPMMRRRYGRIVNLSGLHGAAGGPHQVDYSAATGGVLGLTRALAREAAAWNITANAVAPGLIETEMSAGENVDQLKRMIPMQRLGRPEEVAALVRFLCSEQASYLTGQVITLAGGLG